MKQEDTKNLILNVTIGGFFEPAEHLIKSGISIDGKDERGLTALCYASAKGHDNIVQLLLSQDADVNLTSGFYGCAFQAASAFGHDNIVQLLLSQDADVNLTGEEYGCALQAATAKSHDNIVQLLLAKGADVNLAGENV